MPSERHKIQSNINGSKNTRMNLDESFARMDFRKDEFMHLARYFKACDTMVNMAKKLKRPIRVLDIGCGEIFIPRTLYKSFIVKKADVIERYIGIDIDNIMLDSCKDKYASLIEACKIKLVRQDLTTKPEFRVKDGYFDLVCWFENIEHMKPEFIEPIVKEVSRVLNPETGIALISTPNANGSNTKLPKNHVYEWEYKELLGVLDKHLDVVLTAGLGLNMSKIPINERESNKKLIDAAHIAFGNTAFASVALAPYFSPKYCKNVLYICDKE